MSKKANHSLAKRTPGTAAATVVAALALGGAGCLNVSPDVLRSSSSRAPASRRAAPQRAAMQHISPLRATPRKKKGDIRIPTHYDDRDPARNPDAVIEELLRGANR